ncbi:MAG TPA: DUF397 domain-containing protein [Pseudonocardiaceae bacterium]|nr:DUF397 domain-containing protein [Pseudonocardiaceae bacterium]
MTDRSPLVWRKSSYSSSGGSCVEVAFAAGQVALRDSKSPDAGMIQIPTDTMAAMLRTLTSG